MYFSNLMLSLSIALILKGTIEDNKLYYFVNQEYYSTIVFVIADIDNHFS